jgi:hypothetical protein
MLPLTQLALVASIFLGLAPLVPAAPTANAPGLESRDDPVTPNSFCKGRAYPKGDGVTHPDTIHWSVYIPGQLEGSAQGTGEWGGGFLDNLRGQAGWIVNWQAQLDDAGTGIKAQFFTSAFATEVNVHDAAWLGSDPNNRINLSCDYSP